MSSNKLQLRTQLFSNETRHCRSYSIFSGNVIRSWDNWSFMANCHWNVFERGVISNLNCSVKHIHINMHPYSWEGILWECSYLLYLFRNNHSCLVEFAFILIYGVNFGSKNLNLLFYFILSLFGSLCIGRTPASLFDNLCNFLFIHTFHSRFISGKVV